MRKEKLFGMLLILIFISGLALSGCSSSKSEPEAGKADTGKVYELTFGVAHPMEDPMMSVINTAWKNWIEAESGGRIKIIFKPAEQAAKAPDLYDAAMSGTVDIANQIFAAAPGRFPLTEVTQLPFLFDSPGAVSASLATMDLYNMFPEIQNEFKGVKVLNFHATSLSQIHAVKKEIKTLADFKGLLINGGGTYVIAAAQALGGVPEMLPPGDRYDALNKGVIEANVSEWEGQLVWKLDELTNYATQADMTVYTFSNVMNLNTWNSLPPDLQALLSDENNRNHGMLLGYIFDKDDSVTREKLDQTLKSRGKPGIYVLPIAERERWKEAVAPVYEKWLKDAAGKVGEAKAKEILQAARDLAEEYRSYSTADATKLLQEWESKAK